MSNQTEIVRKELTRLVQGGNAHVTPADVLEEIPFSAVNRKVDQVPYSIWELVEHMRLAQWDIIDFALKPDHVTPAWPEGFWPDQPAESKEQFDRNVEAFLEHLDEIVSLIQSPHMQFFAPIEHAPKYTFFRQFMLLADHNAYHTGQIVMLRRQLGLWNSPASLDPDPESYG